MDQRAIGRVGAAAVLIGIGALGAPASSAATAKPRGDVIGAGARLVSLERGPSGVSGPTRYWSSAAGVVAGVRALIDALPVANPPAICPDDMMVPTVVAFYAGRGRSPFARVSFQLGGCPAATVYRGGRAIAPPLGGARLASTLARITSLMVNSPTH
jgi:hypothetical protein